MNDIARPVIIEATASDRFTVRINPAPDGETFDRDYPTYPQARGYARGLRLYRGWTLIDGAEVVVKGAVS